jgi:hypothetical protein
MAWEPARQKVSPEMKGSIASAAAAILLAGALTAHAQDSQQDSQQDNQQDRQGGVSHKARSTHHSGARHSGAHRQAMAQGNDESDENAAELASDESIPRLPSVFRNCEHPAPWFCTNRYSLRRR